MSSSALKESIKLSEKINKNEDFGENIHNIMCCIFREELDILTFQEYLFHCVSPYSPHWLLCFVPQLKRYSICHIVSVYIKGVPDEVYLDRRSISDYKNVLRTFTRLSNKILRGRITELDCYRYVTENTQPLTKHWIKFHASTIDNVDIAQLIVEYIQSLQVMNLPLNTTLDESYVRPPLTLSLWFYSDMLICPTANGVHTVLSAGVIDNGGFSFCIDNKGILEVTFGMKTSTKSLSNWLTEHKTVKIKYELSTNDDKKGSKRWLHILSTFDGSKLKLYINGKFRECDNNWNVNQTKSPIDQIQSKTIQLCVGGGFRKALVHDLRFYRGIASSKTNTIIPIYNGCSIQNSQTLELLLRWKGAKCIQNPKFSGSEETSFWFVDDGLPFQICSKNN
ncbi:hypothetical protein RFI_28850 [Reticulomyxa filosa]|uniref:LamG-like jellyroll fold domain-containing protein n=1 Tax=Reticulomyxa filosa TaxID=46433 RepID=X6M4G9_RETFI|nr:hypothetical protein RFI_28850 [Reticulomyxa filosa]|eukprot:ETO08536.1 hypothetical protein RFI_28850 [Reticulomyxa filosa]